MLNFFELVTSTFLYEGPCARSIHYNLLDIRYKNWPIYISVSLRKTPQDGTGQLRGRWWLLTSDAASSHNLQTMLISLIVDETTVVWGTERVSFIVRTVDKSTLISLTFSRLLAFSASAKKRSFYMLRWI